MAKKKFRRRKQRLKGKKDTTIKKILKGRRISPVIKLPAKKKIRRAKRFDIALTEVDKLTCVWEVNKKRKCIKVVNVSYELQHKNKWYTVLRFDSEHGKLHCHMRQSIEDETEVLTPNHWIIKRGSPEDWLNWSKRMILNRFINYRKGFLKRSGIKNYY